MKILVILFVFLNYHAYSQISYPEKSWIELLQKFTISIGNTQIDTIVENGIKRAVPYYNILGTGVPFYVKYKNEVIPVIVTAKHVLKNNSNKFLDSIRVRLSSHDDESVYDYLGVSIPLKFENEVTCFEHPDSTIDLVCFPILSQSHGLDSIVLVTYKYFPDDYQIFEGAEIYVLGYPGSVGKTYWTRALLRKAIISWVPKKLDTKKFLIDCNVFPGNSGGPVFTKIPTFPMMGDTSDYDKMYKFIGIVIERRFNYNKVQSLNNGKLNPIKDANGFSVYSAESIGVGVVEPAKNVLSLLRLFEKEINKH